MFPFKLSGALLALALLILTPSLHAATWDGGGADNNWNTANNWDPNGVPAAGAPLTFPSSASKLSNNNNFPALTDFDSITFLRNNYILSGNAVELDAGILSAQPSGTNLLNLGVTLAANQSFTVQNAGAALSANGPLDLGAFLLTIGGEGNIFLGGVVSGTGEIEKTGPGFLRLSGNNTYTGGTSVNGGILEVTNPAGSATGTGLVTVEGGAELQGSGSIAGDLLIQAGGEISPGDDEPAFLGTGNLILDPDAVLVIQLNGPVPETEYSALQVAGTVVVDQAIFRIALGPNVMAGDEFTIISNDSSDPVIGTFKNLDEGETFRIVGIDDVGFEITYEGGSGNDVVLTSIPTISINDVSVDEPVSPGTINATFVVTLSEASEDAITVKYSTSAGTATTPEDYTAKNGTLTFNPGVTSQIISVTIVSDSIQEGEETFLVSLFSPVHASIAKDEGTATITPPDASGGGGGGGGSGNGGGNPSVSPPASGEGCSLNPGAGQSSASIWALLSALLPAFAGLQRMRRRLVR